MNNITRILRALGHGDPHAGEHLWPLVYPELRKLAAVHMAREAPGHTLQPTALVHEAYLRLACEHARAFADRRQFFAAAAQAMHHILVENARRKAADKRGGGRRRQLADLDTLHAGSPAEEILALHEALERFGAQHPLKAKLVELRFFAGLTLAQAADCLNISLSTADRSWAYARSWLFAALAGEPATKSHPA